MEKNEVLIITPEANQVCVKYTGTRKTLINVFKDFTKKGGYYEKQTEEDHLFLLPNDPYFHAYVNSKTFIDFIKFCRCEFHYYDHELGTDKVAIHEPNLGIVKIEYYGSNESAIYFLNQFNTQKDPKYFSFNGPAFYSFELSPEIHTYLQTSDFRRVMNKFGATCEYHNN